MSSYFNNNPEAIHFLLFLFSDRATPVDFQHADIFSVNTYCFTKPVRQLHKHPMDRSTPNGTTSNKRHLNK